MPGYCSTPIGLNLANFEIFTVGSGVSLSNIDLRHISLSSTGWPVYDRKSDPKIRRLNAGSLSLASYHFHLFGSRSYISRMILSIK